MRLYHSRFWVTRIAWHSVERAALLASMMVAIILLTGCSAPQLTQSQIAVDIAVDGNHQQVNLPAGSTVEEALSAAALTLGPLDRTEPPLYTVLTEGAALRLIRVREEFKIEQVDIPFEHQRLRNESMPEGETRLVQSGLNGIQEMTYRRVFEDELEVSNSVVKTVVVREATPEIVMVGSQAPFASFPIPGRLAYLLAGNAWLIDGSTDNRRPIVTTGDLDGRVFALSPDGKWLLYSRTSEEDGIINTLWAARLDTEVGEEALVVNLGAQNVIHYAGWRPGLSYVISYSTVEERASAPGWQANNDLNLIALTDDGQVKALPVQLETNMGGTYGWWGMNFSWSPDGLTLAYTRPDGLGLMERGGGSLISLMDVLPLQTRADWAWVPGLAWSPDGTMLYSVDHVSQPGVASPEESPLFDLTAMPLEGGLPIHLVSQVGMFAYPVSSPLQEHLSGEQSHQVAYLQAIFPTQSDSSRYRLNVIDRDGSNRQTLFPPEGSPGIDPQSQWGVWSPMTLEDSGNYAMAIIYQNNLWLVDMISGSARQITGDDLVSRVDWR